MINGHGDDIYDYAEIKANFSSNVYAHFSHDGLFAHLSQKISEIKNYPEVSPRRLEQVIAQHLNLAVGEVLATSGATQAIYQIAQTFKGVHSTVLVPTFSEYADACRMYDHTVQPVSTLDAIPHNAQLVWICNPNNPTGKLIDKGLLLKYMANHPDKVFIVDVSYGAFTASPIISPKEAVSCSNVVLIHSMTKDFSIPGLRLGFVTAQSSLISKMTNYSLPWSVNQLAVEAGLYLFSHLDDYQIDLDALLAEARRVSSSLRQMGIEVHPSDTHILLCRIPEGKASDLKQFLIDFYGLLIRDASNFEGLDESYFRIAVQSKTENDLLLNGIEKWISR